jgi:RNA ligase
MISNATGKELDYDSLLKINEETGLPVVKKYDGIEDYKTLKGLISKDREGYVVKFRNGFRVKIKGEEYVRLHRILTGFSNVDIWEYLKDNKNLDELLDRVPDEFDSWVRNTIKDIKTEYEKLDNEYKWIFKVLMRSPQSENKKGFAEHAKNYKHSGILFKMFEDKEYSHYIWKQIRPIYSKPFWQKEEL